MTGESGPDEKQPDSTPDPTTEATGVTPDPAKPEPEKLSSDSGQPAAPADADKPAGDPAGAATPADAEGKSLLKRLSIPGARTIITVAAAMVAVTAIALTTWALAKTGDDETATPDDLKTGPVTFGPSQPDVSSLSTLPTLPTLPTAPSLESPTVSPPTSAPLLPSPPTFPSAPYTPAPYTPPPVTFPSAPYTPPTTLPTSPSTTPTSPTTSPGKTQVYPVRPTATHITKCGTYGSLTFPATTGVKYALVRGDGKQGPWVVKASARKGYVIADGAPRRFTGDLGRYRKCLKLGIRQATATPGAEATDPWLVTVRVSLPSKEKRTLSLVYAFDTDVEVVSTSGSKWKCSTPDTDARTLTCTYSGNVRRPEVQASVRAVEEGVPVSGSVTLTAGGDTIESASFGPTG